MEKTMTTKAENKATNLAVATAEARQTTVRTAVQNMDIPEEVHTAADILSDLLARFGMQSQALDKVRAELETTKLSLADECAAHEDTRVQLAEQTERADKLEISLDRSNKFATVRRIKELNPEIDERNIWRKLKSWCITHGEENRKKVPYVNYGEVWSYSKECWCAIYPELNYPEEW